MPEGGDERTRRLRLAVVSYYLPVPGQKRGGIERVAHDLSHGLARRGHDVAVWSYDPAPPGALYRVEAFPGRRFAAGWFGRRLVMGYLGNVLALLPRYGKIDALVTLGDSLLVPLRMRNTLRIMNGSALSEALSAKSPWRFSAQMGVYLQELLTALTHRHTIGVSENTRAYNPFVKRSIPNGVDRKIFYPDPAAKTPEPSILFVGAMDGRKRGSLLLKWFAERVRARFPNATLHLVCRASEAGDGVTYHEGIGSEDLAALYRRCWIYASPSTYEGFGLPYVEAMASGTPVVASPNPGSQEVLDGGQCGVLAEDNEFAGEMVKLLAERDLRDRLITLGLHRAGVYDAERMIDQYESCLYQIASAVNE